MYRTIRNIHLLLGLFIVLFLLMYGISSVQMAHNRWFSMKPSTSESRAMVSQGLDARAAAMELMNAAGLRGELGQIRKTAAGFNFRVTRPGTIYDVAYDPATGEARITTNTAGFMGMLNRLHHVGGLWHGYALINVWGALTGVVALSLLVIGATGVYLWFKLYNERVAGGVMLVASLLFGLTLLVLIRSA